MTPEVKAAEEICGIRLEGNDGVCPESEKIDVAKIIANANAYHYLPLLRDIKHELVICGKYMLANAVRDEIARLEAAKGTA